MRPDEARAVGVAYAAALTVLGLQVRNAAASAWSGVNPTRIARSSAGWLDEVTDLVMDARVAAFELAVAFYRLYRALLTGSTVATPGGSHEPVELGRLRADFLELLPDLPGEVVYKPPSGGMTTRIPVVKDEVFDKAEIAQRERAARAEARSALQTLGPYNLGQRLQKIAAERKAAEVDADREAVFDAVERRQAAAAERIARNGARGAVFDAMKRDSGVIGYARCSRTGTPCGWCAMLISRGPVYKSKVSANSTFDEGNLYHDNCACYAVPVYSMQQYNNDPTFALNRQYGEEWPQVTKGLHGKNAVAAWRRHIRRGDKTT